MLTNLLRHLALLAVVSVLLTPIAAPAGGVQTITAEEWARPRHGEWLLRLPALQATVQAWLRDPAQLIRISYPGGEEGAIWGGELRAWLIALGIDSDHIDMAPGSGRLDAIELDLVPAADGPH